MRTLGFYISVLKYCKCGKYCMYLVRHAASDPISFNVHRIESVKDNRLHIFNKSWASYEVRIAVTDADDV